jgi:hypothetical protein
MDDEKRITLRLPGDLHARLADLARAERRSLNSEIVHLLESASDAAASGTTTPDVLLHGAPIPLRPERRLREVR